MDAVITYVNGLDPVWQSEYSKCVGMETFLEKRFRDWGTLKYLLLGICVNMPFVRNVYLVVSGDTQVPSWVDREQLRIVRHSDIIPSELLPVFNSQAIEMFLHRIEGLDEEFLYFNDDFLPMLTCSYNTDEYSNLKVDKTSAKGEEDSIVVSMDVKNNGSLEGKEIVQLYITDLIASTSRPVIELKGFQKLDFKPGETRTVSFTVTPELLKFYGRDLQYDWESGDFELCIGPNSRDLTKVRIRWVK